MTIFPRYIPQVLIALLIAIILSGQWSAGGSAYGGLAYGATVYDGSVYGATAYGKGPPVPAASSKKTGQPSKEAGVKGAKGATSATSAKGTKGATSAIGAIGAKGATGATGAKDTTEARVAAIRHRLLIQFDNYLQNPKGYADRLEQECQGFPRKDVLATIFPSLAYTNLAIGDQKSRAHARLQAAKLIDLAILQVTAQVEPPNGRLENLRTYQKQAAYLGMLNLALGCYRMIGGDNRFEAIHQRITESLGKALAEENGRVLYSFPDLQRPLDTIVCLVSLRLHDQWAGESRFDKVIRQHLSWIRQNTLDKRLQLPYSIIDPVTGRGRDLARGSDLSFQLCLLPHLDYDYAVQDYKHYVQAFWLDYGADSLAGFREWPMGADRGHDADSGPIYQRIGLCATGFGLGAATALKDKKRFERLCEQFPLLEAIVAGLGGQKRRAAGIPLDPRCYTGSLLGDAALFYVITWQPWINHAPK
ncbi:MAG: hypothetical protein AB1847_11175 [bacterium]